MDIITDEVLEKINGYFFIFNENPPLPARCTNLEIENLNVIENAGSTLMILSVMGGTLIFNEVFINLLFNKLLKRWTPKCLLSILNSFRNKCIAFMVFDSMFGLYEGS